jgi:3-hydroxybutyryl-CoA dehydrogenase
MDKKHVAVLGAGKMSLGIAQLFATKGYPVKIVDINNDRSRYDPYEIIRSNLQVLAENDALEESEIPAILDQISIVETLEEIRDFADIVFEAIIEVLDIKQEWFRKMDEILPEHVILASNTSALSITAIAEKSVHRERIIGTHYWNPAYLIPLVEVVKTEYIAEDTVTRTCELLKGAGKHPVVVQKDAPGFIANRMQHALFREALYIIEQGIAKPEDVDDAIKYGFGMRLGIAAPIEVMDMGGMDLTYNIHKYLFPYLNNSTEPSKLLTDAIAAGNLGFKTGKGIEEWPPEAVKKANTELETGLIRVLKALDRL